LFGLHLFSDLCFYPRTEPLSRGGSSLDLGHICVFLIHKQSGDRGIVSYTDMPKQYWNSNSLVLFFSLVPNLLQTKQKLL